MYVHFCLFDYLEFDDLIHLTNVQFRPNPNDMIDNSILHYPETSCIYLNPANSS